MIVISPIPHSPHTYEPNHSINLTKISNMIGSFGKVFLVRDKVNKTVHALKVMLPVPCCPSLLSFFLPSFLTYFLPFLLTFLTPLLPVLSFCISCPIFLPPLSFPLSFLCSHFLSYLPSSIFFFPLLLDNYKPH